MQQDHLIRHIHHRRDSLRDNGLKRGTRTRPVKVKTGSVSHQTEVLIACLKFHDVRRTDATVNTQHPGFSLAWFAAGQTKKLHFHSGNAKLKIACEYKLNRHVWKFAGKSGNVNKSTSFPWILSVSLSFTAKQMACFLCTSTLYGPTCINWCRQFS